ncbi:hypothetical protein [uncultured Agrococcus sp.]|nr:hypothetical protein [uncultured Agrococcus sp.]
MRNSKRTRVRGDYFGPNLSTVFSPGSAPEDFIRMPNHDSARR